ncbi:Uncharacterised protein [Mycobacteroides abscessus subsp. abscessus]|nr:Uncharacterised protein [Mycobacteroides abscessus subsp. abscessus]
MVPEPGPASKNRLGNPGTFTPRNALGWVPQYSPSVDPPTPLIGNGSSMSTSGASSAKTRQSALCVIASADRTPMALTPVTGQGTSLQLSCCIAE